MIDKNLYDFSLYIISIWFVYNFSESSQDTPKQKSISSQFQKQIIHFRTKMIFTNYTIICSNQTVLLDRPINDDCIDDDMKFTQTNLITIIIYSIIFGFSAIFNVYVIILLYLNKRYKHTRIQLFMFHLFVADLIVTFVTIPIEASWKYSVVWLAGDFGCRLFQFLRPLGIYLSSFIIIGISIDRYVELLKFLK
jgi:hypothetical protein